MKLFNNKKYEYLEKSLKEAFSERDTPEMGMRWKQDIKRSIRHIPLQKKTFAPYLFAEHVVWRFMAVACTMVMILLGYMWYIGLGTTDTFAERFLDDPMQLTIVQVYEEF
jgi:hypothetical protein